MIFIAQGYLVTPLPQKLQQGMIDLVRLSVLTKDSRRFCDPVAKVDLFQEQTAPVGGEVALLEIGHNIQIEESSKIELFRPHCNERDFPDFFSRNYSILS